MLSYYDNKILNFWDRIEIMKLKKEYELYRSADSHNKAEKIRNRNGYSGGIDGSGFIRLLQCSCCKCKCN